MRLLFVEDDRDLADGLIGSLAQSSYTVDTYPTADLALAAVTAHTYDLIILDLGLPDGDGLDLLKSLRGYGIATPVIIMTARDEIADRVQGLDLGADDYLVKPVALAELEARIRMQLRRPKGQAPGLAFGNVEIDDPHRQASVMSQRMDLTAREFGILELLVRARGLTVPKDRLFEGTYDSESDVNLSVVEVHISRLRKKLEAAGADVGVRALRGLGYRLERVRS
jgi:DNA-binding response OmpR family regulator